MSEEEKNNLISKKKYWTKLMKYNLVGTILFLTYVFVILFYGVAERCEDSGTLGCNSILISYLLLSFFLLISWPLSLIMYGYQSFKIYKITKPQPRLLSNAQALTASQISTMKEAKELLDKNIITKSEFDKIKNEHMDNSVVTRLRGIADLRDSGALTEREFQEQKSKILSEAISRNNQNLSFNNQYKDVLNGKNVAIGGGVGLIIVISIISIFSYDEDSGGLAFVEGDYAARGMCWKGAFHNGDSIISISGCGSEKFYCSDKSSCSINAQKDEDNSHELCVSIGNKRACTTAGYGIAQI